MKPLFLAGGYVGGEGLGHPGGTRSGSSSLPCSLAAVMRGKQPTKMG